MMTNTQDAASSISRAIQLGDVQFVDALLSGCNPNDTLKHHEGSSLLMDACQLADHDAAFKISQSLLNHNADIDFCDPSGLTLLAAAVQAENIELIKLLSSYRNNVNQVNRYGYTPLMRATERGCLDCIKLLHELGADVNAKANGGHNALMISIWRNNYACCDQLIQFGAHINDTTDEDLSPLLYAASYQRYEHLKLLLEHNADIAQRDHNGATVLHLLFFNEIVSKTLPAFFDALSLLLDRGADLSALNADNLTAIDIAIAEDLNSVVEFVNNYAERAQLSRLQLPDEDNLSLSLPRL